MRSPVQPVYARQMQLLSGRKIAGSAAHRLGMDMNTARALAHTMMNDHGLTARGWTFHFDNAQRRLGLCKHSQRQITVSRYMTEAATREQFANTMTHEIAHALVGPGHGHGPIWKAKARSLGHSGDRTSLNPYTRPGDLAAVPGLSRTVPAYNVGQYLELSDGLVGRIINVGRSRYKIAASDGRQWFVPFAIAKIVTGEKLEAATAAAKTANQTKSQTAAEFLEQHRRAPKAPMVGSRLPRGTRVKLRNQTGVIEKIARIQYHVRGERDGRLYGVRFAYVQLAESVAPMSAAASMPTSATSAPRS